MTALHSDERPRGRLGRLLTADGKQMDVGQLVVRLWSLVAEDLNGNADAVSDAVRRAVDALPRVEQWWTTAAEDRTVTYIVAKKTKQKRPRTTIAVADEPAFLVELETLGAVGLTEGLDTAAYHFYRVMNNDRRPLPPQIGADPWPTEDLTAMKNLLSCWCYSHGPVGLFWLLPVLFLMYRNTPAVQTWLPWTFTMDMETSCLPWDTTVPSICPGLPPGCDMRLHKYKRGEWTLHTSLANYVQSLLCAHNAPAEDGGRVFQSDGAGWHGRADAETRSLFCLSVAGLPVAIAVVGVWDDNGDDDEDVDGTGNNPSGDHRRYLMVDTFCALTRSRGGTTLMRLLQRHCEDGGWSGIVLVPTATAEFFYKRMGFTSERWFGSMMWLPQRGFDAKDKHQPVDTVEATTPQLS